VTFSSNLYSHIFSSTFDFSSSSNSHSYEGSSYATLNSKTLSIPMASFIVLMQPVLSQKESVCSSFLSVSAQISTLAHVKNENHHFDLLLLPHQQHVCQST
jgi:hypothetical protein